MEISFQKDKHYSRDLEAAILGACLLEKDAFGRTFGIISKENFYFDGNKLVYDAIAEMYNNGIFIDILTVNDYLLNKKEVSVIGGFNVAYYLVSLTDAVICSTHLEYHCYIIKRMWMERELISLTHGGLKLDGEIKQQIFQLSEAIQKINQGVYTKEWTDMTELMYDLVNHQEEMIKKAGKGITTGISILDQENGGFFGGQLIILGARPSVGKSAFMGMMAMAMAKQGHTVGIISLEMNNNEIAARLSSLETDETFRTIYRNLYKDENQRAAWYAKIGNITSLPIYISDATHVSASEIKAKAQKLKHHHGLGCLIVDYLQLVSADDINQRRTREYEVSQISRMCKLMAKEMNIPVMVLCQLNRESTKRTGTHRYPMLSDLRESGSLEQDADVVMFIHRDWLLGEEYMTDESGQTTENKGDLIIRKWRNEVSNLHIPLHFDGPRMLFKEIVRSKIDQWKPEVNYTQDNPF